LTCINEPTAGACQISGMPNRIITLTLNPAVDLACSAASVQHTHKVRTTGEHIDPGGGGINVARVLHALGVETLAVGSI
jgi:6-phosphofructokinase 2